MKHSAIIVFAVLFFGVLQAEAERKPEIPATTGKEMEHEEEVAWPEEIPDYGEQPQAGAKPAMSRENLVDMMVALPIAGEPEIDAEVLQRFVARHNPDFPIEIADAYIKVGRRYGIRGDVALCQSILETGWFRFADGTSVTADQHNYCGLGVVKRGQRGHSFETVEQGVTAQIQHLYAYACSDPIPEGEELVDPRFRLVARGVAPTWSELSGRWAANDRYAKSIMKLFIELREFNAKN